MKGSRYKLWWCGKGDRGVGVMVLEKLCEKVVEIRSVSDGVMTVVVFEEVLLRLKLWVCSTKWKKFRRKAVFI